DLLRVRLPGAHLRPGPAAGRVRHRTVRQVAPGGVRGGTAARVRRLAGVPWAGRVRGPADVHRRGFPGGARVCHGHRHRAEPGLALLGAAGPAVLPDGAPQGTAPSLATAPPAPGPGPG